MKKGKRIVSLVVCLAMFFSMMSASLAEEVVIDNLTVDTNIGIENVEVRVSESELEMSEVTNEPVANESVADEPVIEELVIEESAVNESVAEELVIEEPVANESVANESVADEPAIEELVIEESAVNEPVADELAIEESISNEPTIEDIVDELDIDIESYDAEDATELLLNAFIDVQLTSGKYPVVCDGTVIGKYEAGSTVILEVPVKENYEFTGWKAVSDAEVTINGNQFIMPNAAVGLVSQWKALTNRVTIFYLNEKDELLQSGTFIEVIRGSDFTLDSGFSIPTFAGYSVSSISCGDEVYTDISNYRDIIKVDNIQSDEIFNVYYEAADVYYEVRHFTQTLEGEYEVKSTTSGAGKFGQKIEIESEVISIEGFTWMGLANGEATSIKLAATNNVINIYYSRNTYKLYYIDGVTTLWYDIMFEENVNITQKLGTPAPRAGATFVNWTTSDITVEGNSFYMPAKNVTFTSNWQYRDTATYTINYYVETKNAATSWTADNHRNRNGNFANTNPMDYEYAGTKTATGNVGSIITDTIAKNSASGIVDTAHFDFVMMDENVSINPDGATIVKVYYARKIYAYSFRTRANETYVWDRHTNGKLYYKYGADLSEAGGTNSWPGGIKWMNGSTTYHAPNNATLGNFTLTNNGTVSASKALYYVLMDTSGVYSNNSETGVIVEVFGNSFTLTQTRAIPGFIFDSYRVGTSGTWRSLDSMNSGAEVTINNIGSAGAYVRYSRNKYTISISNGVNVTSTSSAIYYEASLAGTGTFVPLNLDKPEAYSVGYKFAGFVDTNNDVLYAGSTTAEAYQNFVNSNSTMPARNVMLIAKWEPEIYTVNFYAAADLNGDTLIPTQYVEYGNFIDNAPQTPDEPSFIGWYYRANGVEKPWIADATKASCDMDIYAKYDNGGFENTNIVVDHVYHHEDGTIQTITDTVVGVVGTVVTIEAMSQEGYYADMATQNHEVVSGENHIVFNYYPAKEIEYTVYYIDLEGNNLIDPVTKTTDKQIIVENYVYIPFATPRVWAQELRLAINAEDNVITFVYDVMSTAKYTIMYWQQQIDGSYIEVTTDRIVVEGARYYTEVQVTEAQLKNYEGYAFNDSISNTSAWIVPTEEVVFNLYYDLTSFTVSYRYTNSVDGVTLPELPTSQTFNVGETVMVENNQLTIEGMPWYEFKGWYIEGSTENVDTFEMPANDVVLEGYFELKEYYVTVEWEYTDGEYHGGEFSWDSATLSYVQDPATTDWTTKPAVKCTITNYGKNEVDVDLSATNIAWEQFFVDGENPFDNLATTIDGNGTTYVYDFTTDGTGTELPWDYDKLDRAALEVAFSDVLMISTTQSFELSITQ